MLQKKRIWKFLPLSEKKWECNVGESLYFLEEDEHITCVRLFFENEITSSK